MRFRFFIWSLLAVGLGDLSWRPFARASGAELVFFFSGWVVWTLVLSLLMTWLEIFSLFPPDYISNWNFTFGLNSITDWWGPSLAEVGVFCFALGQWGQSLATVGAFLALAWWSPFWRERFRILARGRGGQT